MRILALATDYDGTLAEDGRVGADVVGGLRRLRASGRRVILVTGRELDELLAIFPHVDELDAIVAENGALLFTPRPPVERPLAKPPPPELVAALRARGVDPIACGRIIVATWEPHGHTVREVIRAMGLELEVELNKGAVMILPAGVNKASGLAAALSTLGIAREAVVGVGDGENDHSLLAGCGLGVAVANAVPALKERAALVTAAPRGQGVLELCEQILATDLADARRASLASFEYALPAE